MHSSPVLSRSGLPRTQGALALVTLFTLLGGCEPSAENAIAEIEKDHLPRVVELVQEDLGRHGPGLAKAAERLAPGFSVTPAEKRQTQLRAGLKYVQVPPRGVMEFIASPMSFLAAVDDKGVVIARDAEPDSMAGQDFGARFEVVKSALAGQAGKGLGEFKSKSLDEPSSWSILFTQPVLAQADGATAEADGEAGAPKVAGALVAGIPLWRLAQRLGKQLQVEHAKTKGLVLWVYTFKGSELYFKSSAPELDKLLNEQVPLSRLHAGVSGKVILGGRAYAYVSKLVPEIGPDVGVLVVRGDPL